MVFLEKSRAKFKPYVLKFWERNYGSYWLPWEKEVLRDYFDVSFGTGRKIVRGLVKRLKGKFFALIPTPFTNTVCLICYCYGEMPEERARHLAFAPEQRKIKTIIERYGQAEIETIQRETNMEYEKLKLLLRDLERLGYIYQPTPGIYRPLIT